MSFTTEEKQWITDDISEISSGGDQFLTEIEEDILVVDEVVVLRTLWQPMIPDFSDIIDVDTDDDVIIIE